MIFSCLSSDQISILIVSAIVLITSIFLFHYSHKKASLYFLFLGSLFLGFFIAKLDPFLNLWDEQFHALVAKNILHDPFRPMLYSNPVLGYDYRNWTFNHIWLHKQPLFLWQMALSLKIFGINELAVRIPSIILHSLTGLMIYRIGKITRNISVGFYAALFFIVAYYPLELIVGKYSTDHNDVSFLFYITASFWSWFEYKRSPKSYWLIFIGLFAGCAVLVKWLMGLLIYPVWLIAAFGNERKLFNRNFFFSILTSLIISFIIFIPWQIYIFNQFPLEAAYEFNLNSEHFFRVVENHGGNAWFHYNALRKIYGGGQAVPFILLSGFILYVKKCVNTQYRIAIASAVIITYLFYTIAATKMISFCIIASPFIFLGIAALAEFILNWVEAKTEWFGFKCLFRSVIIAIIAFFLLDISRIQNYHTDWKPGDNFNREADLSEMRFIKKLNEKLNKKAFVIFNSNIRPLGNIPVMFFTDFIAYDFIPSPRQIEMIKKRSMRIAIYNNNALPGYIMDDKDIVKIEL